MVIQTKQEICILINNQNNGELQLRIILMVVMVLSENYEISSLSPDYDSQNEKILHQKSEIISKAKITTISENLYKIE